ncbi:MAG TPA: hypothetical protein VLH60_07450 [Sedimentisphaerales bacterium]|nr:hypothetical protein [Sedimentisphaerales bacterium]
MNPEPNVRTGKPAVFSDIYTALLALALAVVVGTAVFMVIKCLTEYDTIFVAAKP